MRLPRSHEAAAFGKALECVIPNRVEHVVAGVGARKRDGDDGLVDERAEQLHHRHLIESVVGARLDERTERRTASVHRDVVEQRLFVRMQEVVAPLDERREGGAPGVRRRLIAEQLKAAADEGEDLCEPEHVYPRSSELDRERDAVHETADLGSDPGVLVRQFEARARRARSGGEELHGRDTDGVARSEPRHRQGRHGEAHFTRHVKHLATRREHAHAWAASEHRIGDPGRLLDHMLTGVEHEQRVGVAKAGEGARERVAAPRVEGLGGEADDVGATCRAREIDMPRSIAKLALDRSHRLEGEPALADARRPGQCDEAMLPQELDHLGELRLAVDERGRRSGHVAAPLWCDRDGCDRRVVSEDRLLEAPQLRAWLQRQLLQEHLAGLLERLQRVRLASAAVQGKQQVPPQALAERALLQRGAYGGHQVGVLAERESRFEVLLQRVELERVQPRGLGERPRGLRQTKQSGPAPKGERLADRIRSATRIAGAERAARSREQLLELDGVDRHPVKRVPVGGKSDRVVAERSA